MFGGEFCTKDSCMGRRTLGLLFLRFFFFGCVKVFILIFRKTVDIVEVLLFLLSSESVKEDMDS